MKKTFTWSILFFFITNTLHLAAQNVGINSNGASPNLSAILDLDGVTGFTGPNGYKGLLIPRMTSAKRTGIITLPQIAQGLVVYQTDGAQGFYYNTSTTVTPSWIYLNASNWTLTGNAGTTASSTAIGTAVNNNFIGTTDAKDFVFATNNHERMRISSNGNVGILAANPSRSLEVHGNDIGDPNTTQSAGNLLLYSSDNTFSTQDAGGSLGFGSVYTSGGAFFAYATIKGLREQLCDGCADGALAFYTRGGQTFERMRIDQFGNVGIGSTNPTNTLDVNGTFDCDNGQVFSDGSGNLTVNDIFDNNSGIFLSALGASDQRYKEEINPMTHCLENILKLQGVNYLWKKTDFPEMHFNNRLQIGFIAQEVEKIYPELVNTNQKGYKSIDYPKLSPLLVEAIKEQQGIINGQKLENKEQQTQLDLQKLQIEKLQEQLQAISLKLGIETTAKK